MFDASVSAEEYVASSVENCSSLRLNDRCPLLSYQNVSFETHPMSCSPHGVTYDERASGVSVHRSPWWWIETRVDRRRASNRLGC